MRTRITNVLIIAFVILLLSACAARAGTPDGFFEGAPDPAPIVDTLPPPPADACPSVPATDTPLAACPLDPTVYWTGDPDQAPLDAHCNYTTGIDGIPCLHSHIGDDTWYFRCDHGDDPLTGIPIGAEFWGPETSPDVQADVTSQCSGSWHSLSVPS